MERIPVHDFKDYAFAYGAGASILTSALGIDLAFVPLAMDAYHRAWNEFLATYDIELRYDEAGEYSEDDIEALRDTGLTEEDLSVITEPLSLTQPEGALPERDPEQGSDSLPSAESSATADSPAPPEDSPSADSSATATESSATRNNSGENDPVIIPTNTDLTSRYDYELTYYVNDISYGNTQVATEYGKRGELKGNYTYGTERIARTDADGSYASYLYDGRGSVAQTFTTEDTGQGPSSTFPDHVIYPDNPPLTGDADEEVTSPEDGIPNLPSQDPVKVPIPDTGNGQTQSPDTSEEDGFPEEEPLSYLSRNYTYDPLGNLTSDIDPNSLAFTHNAEEYNPATSLTYLRARYLDSASSTFLTKDTELGSVGSLNSQSRYLFAEADPVNNIDPSGHAIGNSSYERAMEAAGGINEIYNFYVGQTLTNSYNQASASFYSKLAYAYGVDYTSQGAINSIAGISQAEANWFINQGAAAAAAIGRTYGCTPGALTNMAVNMYATDVNRKKDSVNSQIASVKANKQSQHNEWVAYMAYQAWLAAQVTAMQTLAALMKNQNASTKGSNRLSKLDAEEMRMRAAAIDYAYKWNTGFNPDYILFGADCANFASQILHAGGFEMTDDWHSYSTGFKIPIGGITIIETLYQLIKNGTFYRAQNWDNTGVWSVADEQYRYFSNPANGYMSRDTVIYLSQKNVNNPASYRGVRPGDLLYFDHDSNGTADHTAVVSRVDQDGISYTAHTEPRFDEKLSGRIGDETVYIIRLDY
jgi:RHS repeat-associated protein